MFSDEEAQKLAEQVVDIGDESARQRGLDDWDEEAFNSAVREFTRLLIEKG